MDKNKQIAELLETGCYIDYTTDAGKIAILRGIDRRGDLWKFLATFANPYSLPIVYLLDDTGKLRDKAIRFLKDTEVV